MSVLYKKKTGSYHYHIGGFVRHTYEERLPTEHRAKPGAGVTLWCVILSVEISKGSIRDARWVPRGTFRWEVFERGRGREGCGGRSVGVSGS